MANLQSRIPNNDQSLKFQKIGDLRILRDSDFGLRDFYKLFRII